jgi:indole-3-glycerol phosphate synthase
MDFLQKIVAAKKREIAESSARVPLAQLREMASKNRVFRGFAASLAQPGVRVIAEIKRASPSKGDLCVNLDPAALARAYEAAGAAALSVLTERDFFKGSPEDLQAARAAVSLPVLRKDFILDEYQVYETVCMGADAMLLIVRMLNDNELTHLDKLARALGLDVLVEVHNEADAARANRIGARLIGINNRDLARFNTDASNASRMAALFPPEAIIVAASAITGADDIRHNLSAGISRFLIGEALVCADNPSQLLRTLVATKGAP